VEVCATDVTPTATQKEDECSQDNEVSLNYDFGSSMHSISLGSLVFSCLSSDFRKEY
jgi:hypothetical protein